MEYGGTGKGSAASREPGITLAFVGDICLAGDIRTGLSSVGRLAPVDGVREVLGRADIAVGNLECCLTADAFPENLPKNIMAVPAAVVDKATFFPLKVLGLANNHVMDAGLSGLLTTKQFLEASQIASFGAGEDVERAEGCVSVEVEGVHVAFLGACDVTKYGATAITPGIAPLSLSRLANRIRAAKSTYDLVVVVLHADLEFTHYPSPGRMRLSRQLIDGGADAVIQHHPHVCQGIEYYRHGVIAYSLGNFIFPVAGNSYMQSHEGTGWGVILFLHVQGSRESRQISWSLEPVTIGEDNCPTLSVAPHRENQLRILERISAELRNPGKIRRHWWNRCVAEGKTTYYVLAHTRRRLGTGAMLKAVASLLRDPYERRWMYGALSGGLIG